MSYILLKYNNHTFLGQLNKLMLIIAVLALFPNLLYAKSGDRCLQLFQHISVNNEEDPYAKYELLEASFVQLNKDIYRQYSSDFRINKSLKDLSSELEKQEIKLERLQENIIEGIYISKLDFKEFALSIKKMRQTLFSLKSNTSELRVEELEVSYLDEVIQDPTQAKAEKLYLVDLESNKKITVIFAKNIIKEVLSDYSKQRIASRALNKISKGIFGTSYKGDGVIRMNKDSKVVEVRMRGKDGKFRLFGYLKNSILHIVQYSNSSNHNHNELKKTIAKVRVIRTRRDRLELN